MHKVLVVDDSKMVRKILRKNFLSIDIEEDNFFEAEDGNEAIEMMMLAENVSLIVTDINMPGMDGPSFVKMVRKNPEYASAKIVVLSSVANDENIEKFHGYQVDSFLNKPFTPESFENVIVPLLFTSEITQTLEKMFESKIKTMDITPNRVVFDKEFIGKCLDECEGVNLDFEELLKVVASKKLRLKSKDKVYLNDDELIIEKFVDLEREKRKRIKDVREKVARIDDEDSLIESSIYEIYSKNIDFKEISNYQYEIHYQSIIKKGFINLFTERFAINEIEAQVFVEYLFDKKLKEINLAIADFMVVSLGRGNKDITKFINYYSGGAKIIDGKRYKVAPIIGKDKQRLLIKDIVAVAKRANKLKTEIHNTKTKLQTTKSDLHALSDTLEESTKFLMENEKTLKPEEKKDKESIIEGLEKEIFAIEQDEENLKNSFVRALESFEAYKPQFEEIKECIVVTLSTKSEPLDGGSLEEIAETTEEKKEPTKEENITLIKEMLPSEQFIEKLLSEPKLFLEEILENSDELLKTIATNIINNSKLRATFNFIFITDYKNFEPKKIMTPLTNELLQQFQSYINEKYKQEESILDFALNNEDKNLREIAKIANFIVEEKKPLFAKVIANSFIECADSIKQEHVKTMKQKAPILESAIVGVEHNNSLVQDGNTVIINKLSPLWVRIKQAGKRRKESLTKVKKSYHSVKPKFDETTKEIQLIQKAGSIKLAHVKKWNFDKLQKTFEDNPTQREVLSFLPKGEVTEHFIHLSKKQASSSNEMEAGEGQKYLDLFISIENKNSIKELEKKMSILKIELGKLEIILKEKKTVFDKELAKGLEEYDKDLKKIFTLMSKNIANKL